MAEAAHEACGIVGVYTPDEDAARTAFFGLFSLQHRGQESAGIATSDGQHEPYIHTSMGLVAQAFHEFDLQRLPGHIAIGHTRYSTMGSSDARNAQPFLVHGLHGGIGGERVWMGLGSWLFMRSPERIQGQLDLAQSVAPPGIALFSYDALIAAPEILEGLRWTSE